MKIDFFKNTCRETIDAVRFGLCDDDDKTPAKIKISDEDTWLATVWNDKGKTIEFTAIDYGCWDFLRKFLLRKSLVLVKK